MTRSPADVPTPAGRTTAEVRILHHALASMQLDEETRGYSRNEAIRRTSSSRPDPMTAVNSHALRLMAQEAVDYQGDLWIVYAGNNEMVGPFGAATSSVRARPA